MTTTVGSFISDAFDVVVQQDGKIVAAGFATNGVNWDIALVRYNGDGTLDDTFGTGGIVTTDIDGNNDHGGALVITNDQKIVVAGSSLADPPFYGAVTLARYDGNGALDSTFGSDGVELLYIDASVIQVTDVALQADGKILVAGNTDSDHAFLLRCDANGDPDLSFAQPSGWATAGVVDATLFSAIAVQPDGKLLAAGTLNEEPGEVLVVRFQTDGTLDPTFGDGGLAYTYAGGVAAGANAVAVQSDGRIIVGGWFSPTSGDADWLLLRYLPDGSLDPDFDGDGMVSTTFDADDAVCHALTLQQDGAILLAGQVEYEPGDIGVARYLVDGTPDPTFGNEGLVATDLGTFYEGGRGIVLQSDGKILVCGWAATNGVVSMMVARYQNDLSSGSDHRPELPVSLYISPRPTADLCTVVVPFDPKPGTMARVLDLLGRERKKCYLTGSVTQIDVGDLAPGRYTCMVDHGATRYEGVIVKL